MLGRSPSLLRASRSFSTTSPTAFKACVVGAAGGIGQPLALLLKNSPHVTHLSLYDVAKVTPGVAADLSHIETPAKVSGFSGDDLAKALEGCDVVVVPAGVPRKPGMTRDDLFNTNASIVKNISETFAKACPKAALLIISNPVNSTVPIAAEVLKKAGVYNPKKLFGVTTLDICRANTFVAENQKMDVHSLEVTVVGGHAGTTILPLLSQVKGAKFSDADRDALTHRIQFGGDEVVAAKDGGGSATLSMAFAGARFANSVMRAMKGESVTECTFVESTIIPNTPFFSSPVTLGKNGVEKIHGLGTISDYEQKKLQEMLPDLQAQIKKGIAFANK